MPSDRTRLSYDARQQYRAVVEQQGRAMVEADWNEAFQITGEEQRKEALDFVGPAGTPDNGYEIGFPPAGGLNFDLNIRPGTMYVGGLRVELPPRPAGELILYSNQPDWFTPIMPTDPNRELIFLALLEQEISAVEDDALKDVALGGVDTAQRLRIVQRVQRMPTDAATCDAAMVQAQTEWAALGLEFDPATLRLTPVARLQAGFVDDGTPPDLCEPTAQGGYLEADNQLIRVQISAAGEFTWGYDNAAFLYRITVDPDDATLVHLGAPPVDEFHAPRLAQVVEILRPDFALSNGQLVAEPRGTFMPLAAAYNPDGQSLTLPSPVSMDFTLPDGSTQTYPYLFLRVWEETVAITPGTAQALGSTGVQVTLTAPGNRFTLGAAWAFAVRPSTPVEIYPPRYAGAPQPPEGPRAWVCPLAVIGWAGTTGQVLEDCREHFDNLVELTKRKTGCGCCVTLSLEDVDGGARLQEVIDALIAQAQGAPVTVSLRPGIYKLPETLRLGPAHRLLTLEGCDRRVLLEPVNPEDNFIDGLIGLAESHEVTLRRLMLRPGPTRFFSHTNLLAGMEPDRLLELVSVMGENKDAFEQYLNELAVAIAVRAAECEMLRVEDCTFVMQQTPELRLFQVGIFLSGDCPQFTALNNHFGPFQVTPEIEEPTETPPVSFGILHTGTVVATLEIGGEAGTIEGGIILPELDRALIAGNFFQGIGAAVLVQTQNGQVRIEDNLVRQCFAGVLWLSVEAFSGVVSQVQTPWSFWAEQAAGDPLLDLGLFLGRAYPLPAHFETPPLQSGSAGFNLFMPIPKAPGLPGTLMAITLRAFFMLEAVVFNAIFQAFPRQLVHDILLAENNVEALRRVVNRETERVASGYAYLLWEEQLPEVGAGVFPGRMPSSVILSANRGVNRTHDDGIPTALVLFAGYCSITGGHLRNRTVEQSGPTLVALPTGPFSPDMEPPISVTGNVFHGQRPFLPARVNVPPPMDDWVFFNAWLPG